MPGRRPPPPRQAPHRHHRLKESAPHHHTHTLPPPHLLLRGVIRHGRVSPPPRLRLHHPRQEAAQLAVEALRLAVARHPQRAAADGGPQVAGQHGEEGGEARGGAQVPQGARHKRARALRAGRRGRLAVTEQRAGRRGGARVPAGQACWGPLVGWTAAASRQLYRAGVGAGAGRRWSPQAVHPPTRSRSPRP